MQSLPVAQPNVHYWCYEESYQWNCPSRTKSEIGGKYLTGCNAISIRINDKYITICVHSLYRVYLKIASLLCRNTFGSSQCVCCLLWSENHIPTLPMRRNTSVPKIMAILCGRSLKLFERILEFINGMAFALCANGYMLTVVQIWSDLCKYDLIFATTHLAGQVFVCWDFLP